MTPVESQDLGHGVYLNQALEGEVLVTSPRLDLGWRVAAGETPGTAVVWREVSYEVIDRVEIGHGHRWILSPWDEAFAMRDVFQLEPRRIHDLAEQKEIEGRGQKLRWSTLCILPLLGVAPAAVQKQWRDEWGFEAELATQISAVLEMLVGAVGIIQIAAAAFGGEFFMPPILAYPAAVLFGLGVARLVLVFSDGEPVGSPLGLPMIVLRKKKVPPSGRSLPTVQSFDADRGVLILASAVLRRDWDREGTLHYHGQRFGLHETNQEGRSWTYRFHRLADEAEGGSELRLLPPPEAPYVPRHQESTPPPFFRSALMTAAMTLAPRADQEIWAAFLKTRAGWLTVIGASAELIGGATNFSKDSGAGHPALLLLDLYLVGEGLMRLGSALGGRPMGSVFGWLLRPLYRRWLPSGTDS